jgi:hypothetical protein
MPLQAIKPVTPNIQLLDKVPRHMSIATMVLRVWSSSHVANRLTRLGYFEIRLVDAGTETLRKKVMDRINNNKP